MKADPFTSTRRHIKDSEYQYTFKFASGAQYVFTCRHGEEIAQLNWRMGGGTGDSPQILRRRAQEEQDAEEKEAEDEKHGYLYQASPQVPTPAPMVHKPSGMTIAERKRRAKLAAAFQNRQ